MSDIRNTIASYLDHADKCGTELSDDDLRAFVGMLQTDEADLSDFAAVGGRSLVDAVCRRLSLMDFLLVCGFEINDHSQYPTSPHAWECEREVFDLPGHRVRVCRSNEGEITLYRFDGWELAWKVEFCSSTPDVVIIAAIRDTP